MPEAEGISVDGRLPALNLDQWLALAKTTSIDRAQPLFLGADLELAEFDAYGQQLGSTGLRVARDRDNWLVNIDSEALAGRIEIPRNLASRAPIQPPAACPRVIGIAARRSTMARISRRLSFAVAAAVALLAARAGAAELESVAEVLFPVDRLFARLAVLELVLLLLGLLFGRLFGLFALLANLVHLLDFLEQRVLQHFLLEHLLEFERGHLEQLQRLLQLRCHDQLLALPEM